MGLFLVLRFIQIKIVTATTVISTIRKPTTMIGLLYGGTRCADAGDFDMIFS